MMKKLSMAFLFMLLTSCQSQKTCIVFFGDSITEMGIDKGGYIDRLQSALNNSNKADEFELIGEGIGGNKIYDLYLRMESDVISKKPDVVVIFEGVNDVWHKVNFRTGTDPDKYEKFYAAIIERLLAEGIKVILVTPACIGEKKDNSNDSDEDLNDYCWVIRKLAVTYQCNLVDFRKSVQDYEKANNSQDLDYGLLTTDMVHLSDAGNQLLADSLQKVLGF
jgi:lysophospholipase L1-like esterase